MVKELLTKSLLDVVSCPEFGLGVICGKTPITNGGSMASFVGANSVAPVKFVNKRNESSTL